MIEHGFGYRDLAEMRIEEIAFWAEELNQYYEKKNRVMEAT